MPVYAFLCDCGHVTERFVQRPAGRRRARCRCGRMARRSLLHEAAGRNADTGELTGKFSGCHPSQAAEFSRQFGHLGVSYDARTGHAHYANRRAQLRVLKARGMHNLDEVRG